MFLSGKTKYRLDTSLEGMIVAIVSLKRFYDLSRMYISEP